MDVLTRATPGPALVDRSHDPLAVAVANASLFGAGYLMLGRRGFAAVAGLVTVALVALLVPARSVWAEVVVLLWWVALVGHGWLLAGGTVDRATARGQRLVALGVTVPVLLTVGLLRFDAARIERTVTEARGSGDCTQALAAVDGVRFGHRAADGPLTARVDRTVEACRRVRMAEFWLSIGSTGHADSLRAGFEGLISVLAELPGHERMVDVVLDGFLGNLPTRDPCRTITVTDWLRERQPSDNALDRSADVVARSAPAALVGCGDDLMADRNWAAARTRYQQLLDQYPGQPELVARAGAGVRQATLAIELANVRGLLTGPTGTRPEYCDKPARYSGAPPYRKGNNRALFYGNEEYPKRLPAAWRATDVTGAVLVVCLGQQEYGSTVRTCPYENKLFPQFPRYVAFRRIAIPVRAYELRTGKLVVDTKVQISGSACPRILTYTRYGGIPDLGPPSEVYVTPSDATVRAAFRSLIAGG